jgi:peroxiredoxin
MKIICAAGKAPQVVDFFRCESDFAPLPSALTPTCTSRHAQQFKELYETFRSKGLGEVYRLSLNNALIMNQWAWDVGVKI